MAVYKLRDMEKVTAEGIFNISHDMGVYKYIMK